MAKKRLNVYYFMCDKCRHVVKSDGFYYYGPCPVCCSKMKRSTTYEALHRYLTKKGGVKVA